MYLFLILFQNLSPHFISNTDISSSDQTIIDHEIWWFSDGLSDLGILAAFTRVYQAIWPQGPKWLQFRVLFSSEGINRDYGTPITRLVVTNLYIRPNPVKLIICFNLLTKTSSLWHEIQTWLFLSTHLLHMVSRSWSRWQDWACTSQASPPSHQVVFCWHRWQMLLSAKYTESYN